MIAKLLKLNERIPICYIVDSPKIYVGFIKVDIIF